MLKLMKYEFRKTMFSKLIVLAAVAVIEGVFLYGYLGDHAQQAAIGSIALFLASIFGILYFGIESIITLHKDLNTKQSYMLFLTPKTSYQILGAKLIENAITIIAAGLIFAGIFYLDITMMTGKNQDVGQVLELLNEVLRTSMGATINFGVIASMGVTMLASWLLFIVTGDLAVILVATVLAGRKFSGLVAVIVFFVLNYIFERILGLLPSTTSVTDTVIQVVGTLVISVIVYIGSGWTMERKLSV